MRRVYQALTILAMAGVSPHEGALAGEPLPRASAEPAEPSEPGPAHASEASPPPRVMDVAPIGDRVELDQPLVVRFDRDVPASGRSGLLELEPPADAVARWPDARTLELVPTSWRAGRAQRARVRVPGGDTTEWVFRSRVPAPRGVRPGEGARFVLTFDDGPNDRRQADRLLDRLKELRIRALFFPNGRWANKRPDWVERAVLEGHRVCNHTQNHVNLTAPWMTEARILSEIENGASDGECRLFRPPLMGYDARVERIAASLGYEIYLWDVDSRDWEGVPAEDVMNTVLTAARPDAVALFHIHSRVSFGLLPALAQRLRDAGYVLSWDPEDAVAAKGVGPGGRDGHREWGAELERPNSAGPAPEPPEGWP